MNPSSRLTPSDRARRLYVGKLQHFTQHMVKRYFDRFGRVEAVVKHSPYVSFAFVYYEEEEAVDRVMQSCPHFLDHDIPSLSTEVNMSCGDSRHHQDDVGVETDKGG